MAGKITSMNKIKQVLIMHRNGISNRKCDIIVGDTSYFFANSASVDYSVITTIATWALNSVV